MNSRVTTTHPLTAKEREQIEEQQKQFNETWGRKIKKEIVEDINEIFYDKESIKPTKEIFQNVLQDYTTDTNIFLINKEYDKRAAWSSFLKALSAHPFYSGLVRGGESLSKICAFLGALQKQIKTTDDKEDPDQELDLESKTFQKIIHYGKNLLGLLEDPTMLEALSNINENSDSEKKNGENSEEKQAKALSALKNLDLEQIKTLDLATQIGLVMRHHKKGKENWTQNPDDGLDIRQMEGIREIQQILPTDMALPSDVFYPKLIRRELTVRGYTTKKEHKQILYMLVDISTSMRDPISTTTPCSRIARAIAIAYIRKMTKYNDITALRFFGDGCTSLLKASNIKEASVLINKLLTQPTDQDNTNIPYAVYTAIKDIESTKKENALIKEADILLISDGKSNINAQEMKKKLGKIKLHTALIGCKSDALKFCSETYMIAKKSNAVWEMAKIMNSR